VVTPAAAARPASTDKRALTRRLARRKRDNNKNHPERGRAATTTAIAKTKTFTSALKTVPIDDDQPSRGRSASPSAEQMYASAIGDHHLLSSAEEIELSRGLEAAEVALWERLIAGPLGPEARAHLRALDPPVEATSGAAARAADLDRMIAARVIEVLDRRLADPAVAQNTARRLRRERAALHKLEHEADRIRERFATCNLRLVPSTIRRHGYHNTVGLLMEDLIQEGNLGLLRAIPRFDHRRGLRFSTFATWWIRHFLVRARQNQATEVRVPVHLHDLASKARRAKDEFRDKHGREPSTAELARVLKVSTKSLVTLESTWLKHRESLPSFDSVGEDGELPSQLTSSDEPVDEILAVLQEDDRIAAAIADMPSTLGQILRRRFGLGGSSEETLKQIGKSMDLSRERIRQLEAKALELLRQKLDGIVNVAA
jgi:RNA polymerase sigma factor (sigma-70 family)